MVSAILTSIVLALAAAAAYVYLFGISPETQRKLERKALETMGENKASYVLKDQISKIPASDEPGVKEVKQTLGNAAGGLVNNPIGGLVGETGDSLTGGLTGRQGNGGILGL